MHNIDLPNLTPPAELLERREAEARRQRKTMVRRYVTGRDALRIMRIWHIYGPRNAARLTVRPWAPWVAFGVNRARRLTLAERLKLAVFGA